MSGHILVTRHDGGVPCAVTMAVEISWFVCAFELSRKLTGNEFFYCLKTLDDL